MRTLLILGAAALALGACATSPKQTVAGLNHKDPEFRTRDCRAARAAAARYANEQNGRMVVALAGNLVVPFAGTAAAGAMTAIRADDAKALNERIKQACVSKRMARR